MWPGLPRRFPGGEENLGGLDDTPLTYVLFLPAPMNYHHPA